MPSPPRILYAVDFPPSNQGGGDTLLYRLLQGYPADSLFIFSSIRRGKNLSGPFGAYKRLLFPEITGEKHDGIAQMAMLMDRLLAPLLTLVIMLVIHRWKPGVILTVAHGYYFLAATLAARIVNLPLVLIVHDDWVVFNRHIWLFRKFTKNLLGWALRRATCIYVVCPAMGAHLREEYGVQSVVQYPGTSPNPFRTRPRRSDNAPLRVVFTGGVYDNNSATIGLAVRVVAMHQRNIELHLYSNLSLQDLRNLGWDRSRVRSHGWVAEGDLQRALAEADILFLPLSFGGTMHWARTSFPSKAADYLAAGRPILLVAPAQSPIARYAQENGSAELVAVPSESAIIEGIERIVRSSEHAQRLTAHALSAFWQNHNLDAQRSEVFGRLASLVEPLI